MILEALVVAGGALHMLRSAGTYWIKLALQHPFLLELGVWLILLAVHGGSSDGAIQATLTALIVGVLRRVVVKYHLF